MNPDDLLLGVDGGGTKTEVWLAVRTHPQVAPASAEPSSPFRVLGRGVGGPGNPRAVGFERAMSNIQAAIAKAFEDAGSTPNTVEAIACCLAGAGRSEEQERIDRWIIEQRVARLVVTTGDADPILSAASDDGVGVAVIAGTGSLALGRNQQNEMARSGGWGYLIGDEGSAYQIALSGLRAAVIAADGRGPQTHLLQLFLDHWRLTAPSQLIEPVYRNPSDRKSIAELATLVFQAETYRDEVASHLVENGARELAKMVHGVAQKLHLLSGSYSLAFAGGVLVAQESYRDRVLEALKQMHAAPARSVVVRHPVKGALHMASRLSSQPR